MSQPQKQKSYRIMHSKTPYLLLPRLPLSPFPTRTPTIPQNKQTNRTKKKKKKRQCIYFCSSFFPPYPSEEQGDRERLAPSTRNMSVPMLKQRRNTKVSSGFERMPTFQLSHLLHAARRRNLTQRNFLFSDLLFSFFSFSFFFFFSFFCLFSFFWVCFLFFFVVYLS